MRPILLDTNAYASFKEHGCVVCTHDQHFGFIDGLISGNTPTDLFI